MNAAMRVLALAGLGLAAAASGIGAPLTATDIAGKWAGTLVHDSETQPVAMEFVPKDDGKVDIFAWIPVIHLDRSELGTAPFAAKDNEVQLGPFKLAYDATAKTLSGNVPAGLAPVYAIPMTLHRVEKVEFAPRAAAKDLPAPKPVWTFEAGAALWAGPTFADDALYAGDQDGVVHALDARTGKERWSFKTGGAVRTRPTVAADALYVQADDGYLYKIGAADGKERWRVAVVDKPVERLPFDNPKSRFDRFGSDVTVDGGQLYLGTHGGRVLALEPTKGTTVWEFAAGDAVLAAPAVRDGRVYFGSYDKNVYALDAATGKLVWKTDTKGAVVSTPALTKEGDLLVVGNRAYDLLGIDAKTGAVAWKQYIWFSWVESSVSIEDGVAYVGSSDAAAAYAFDARAGRPIWKTDVFGWAWGQLAVDADRVYVGASSQVGYTADHDGGVMALDRKTGRMLWRAPATRPEKGPFGFPGSPALGAGLVFASSLDGKVCAFAP
jgi:eukaryotic-like serine/threonine-protein kinase